MRNTNINRLSNLVEKAASWFLLWLDSAWCVMLRGVRVGAWVGFRGVVGAVARSLLMPDTCWKRISHPMWNEGLSRTAAEGAGERMKWRRSCCARVWCSCTRAIFPLSQSRLKQPHPHVHAVLVPVRRVRCCGYGPDCSHHRSPCSIHQKQADR